MSLSPATLSSIQQAGQALHEASLAVADCVRDGAQRMVTTIANQPFHSDSDKVFARFRASARLAHDLQSLEEQLRALYNTASELVSQDLDVLVALPDSSSVTRKRVQREAPSSAAVTPDRQEAEDVVVVVKTTHVRKTKREGSKPAMSHHLTANDSKLLDYLQKTLSSSHWTKLTGTVMAQGAGMALGSVGVCLGKLVKLGLVKKADKGNFRMAA
jgi:hypothetical protein